MGVDPGRGEGRMSEKLLYGVDFGSFVEHCRCEGVAQCVGAFSAGGGGLEFFVDRTVDPFGRDSFPFTTNRGRGWGRSSRRRSRSCCQALILSSSGGGTGTMRCLERLLMIFISEEKKSMSGSEIAISSALANAEGVKDVDDEVVAEGVFVVGFCLGLHVLEPEYALYFFSADHVGEIFTKPGEGDVGCGIGGDVAAFVEESEECSEALRLSADRAWGDAVACEACHPGSDVVEGNVGGGESVGVEACDPVGKLAYVAMVSLHGEGERLSSRRR